MTAKKSDAHYVRWPAWADHEWQRDGSVVRERSTFEIAREIEEEWRGLRP